MTFLESEVIKQISKKKDESKKISSDFVESLALASAIIIAHSDDIDYDYKEILDGIYVKKKKNNGAIVVKISLPL